MPKVAYLFVVAIVISGAGCLTDFDSAGSGLCGNGVLDGAEVCDDGNRADGDGCDTRCRDEPGWSCNDIEPTFCRPTCGDDLVVGDETCDGSNVDGKTCALFNLGEGDLRCGENCQLDLSSCGSGGCGDGLADPGEACDGGDINGEACEDHGYSGGGAGVQPGLHPGSVGVHAAVLRQRHPRHHRDLRRRQLRYRRRLQRQL